MRDTASLAFHHHTCTIEGLSHTHIDTHHREMYIYIYVYSRPLFHPRRSVEFKRITETTRRRGRSERRIHPPPSSIRPPVTHLSPSHSSILRLHTCLVRGVVSSASPSFLAARTSRTYGATFTQSPARTRREKERGRAPATSLLSSLSTYWDPYDDPFAMQIASDRC